MTLVTRLFSFVAPGVPVRFAERALLDPDPPPCSALVGWTSPEVARLLEREGLAWTVEVPPPFPLSRGC